MEEYLILRKHEKDYMLRFDEKYLGKFKEVMASAIDLTKELEKKHSKAADIKMVIDDSAKFFNDKGRIGGQIFDTASNGVGIQ